MRRIGPGRRRRSVRLAATEITAEQVEPRSDTGRRGARLPPGMDTDQDRPGTASVALLGPGGRIDGYLNATPRQGDETLASWRRFRPQHNQEEGDHSVRLLAATHHGRFRIRTRGMRDRQLHDLQSELPGDRLPRDWATIERGGRRGSTQRPVAAEGRDAGASRVELCRMSERPPALQSSHRSTTWCWNMHSSWAHEGTGAYLSARKEKESHAPTPTHCTTSLVNQYKENALMTMTTTKPVLEPEAQAFADATANPPYLFDLGPIDGRNIVDQVQSGEIAKPEVAIEDTTIPGGPNGDISVRIIRPPSAIGVLPVVLYTHGAGWVFGKFAHPRSPHSGAGRWDRSRSRVSKLQPLTGSQIPDGARGDVTPLPAGWPSTAGTSCSTALAWQLPAIQSVAT